VWNGYKIRFWHNVWCGDQARKTSFIDLFSIARFKDAAVVNYLELFSASLMAF
jgi:hypothetical protein